MPNVYKLQALIGADDKELQSVTTRAEKRLDQLAQKATGIGRSMTMAVTTPILAAAGYGVKQLVQFDEQMHNVNSIAGQTEQQLESTSKSVLDLSEQFGKGAYDLSKGLYDINSSGFQGKEGLIVLTAATKAASAGVADVGQSASGLTAVLNAYGLAASDAGRISDIMFQTVKDGVITFPQLSTEIGDVISTASAAKVPFEEIGGAIAAMTVKGVKSSESMTALNQVMLQLISPSDTAKKAAKELGIEWLAAGKGAEQLEKVGLQKTMEEIAEKTHGSVEEFAKLFPEVRSFKGALILAADGGKTFEKFVANAMNSAGAATAALKEQQKSFAFQFEQTWATINRTLIETANQFGPEMKGIADSVKGAVQEFRTLPLGVQKSVAGLALLTAAAGPAVWALGSVTSAAATLGITLSVATLGPVVAIVAALGLAVYGVVKGVQALSTAEDRHIKQMQSEAKAAADNVSKTSALVTEYEKLRDKKERTAAEGEKLRSVMNQISKLSPELIKGYDKQGNAIGLLADYYDRLANAARSAYFEQRKATMQEGQSFLKAAQSRKASAEAEVAKYERLTQPTKVWRLGEVVDVKQPPKLSKSEQSEVAELLRAAKAERDLADKQVRETRSELTGLMMNSGYTKAPAVQKNTPLSHTASGGGGGGGGGGDTSGPTKAAKELTAAQQAAAQQMDSLNQKLREYREQTALANDSSQEASVRYHILRGDYADVTDAKRQELLADAIAADQRAIGISMMAAQTEETNTAALAAEQLAGIQSGALLDSLKSLAEVSDDQRMRNFLDNFSAYLPKDLSTIPTLGALREYIKTLPEEVKKAWETVDQAISETGSRNAAKGLQDRLKDAVSGAREEYVKLLAEGSNDGGMQAWVEHLASPELLESVTDLKSLEAVYQTIDPAIRAAAEAMAKWESMTSTASEATKRQQDAMESLDRMLSDQGVELSQLTGKWTTQDDILRALNITAADLSEDGLAKLNQAIANAADIEAATGVRKFLDDMQGMFADSFESIFTDGFGSFFDNVLGGLDKLLQQMAAKILAAQVTNWLVDLAGGSSGVFGALAGLFVGGNGASAAATTAGAGAMGDFNFGGFAASGGPVRAGTPYIVGEKGPELFIPRGGGHIVPNNQLAMAGASGGGVPNVVIHQSFTIVTPTPESFRRSEGQILDAVGRRTEEVLRRNGR